MTKNKINYKIDLTDEFYLEITALDNGTKMGHLNVMNEDKYLVAMSVIVYDGHRRQGIATEMYQLAQKTLNKPFKRSEEQSPEAEELWRHLEETIEIVY